MSEPILVDTSALYAILDADDVRSPEASSIWDSLLDGIDEGEIEGVTHNAIVIEASALVQRRLGVEALRDLHDALLPVLTVHWVDAPLHTRAVTAMLAARKRDVSLVDWTSFELMRMRAIERAFAFDEDFADQGFGPFE